MHRSPLMSDRFLYRGPKNHVPMTRRAIEMRDEFISVVGGLVTLTCGICGNAELTEIGQIDRYGFYYPTGICERCGNVQQREYYDEQAIATFYESYYRFIYSPGPPERLFQDQLRRAPVVHSSVKAHLQPEGSVLEVGTASGGLLKYFLDLGHQVEGCDFDDRYVEYGRRAGVPITLGGLDQIEQTGRQYDLIILSHVLEHIVRPIDLLRKIQPLLRERGVLYVEIPSLNRVLRGGYGFDLLRYYQNAHVTHFSKETLAAALTMAGFELLSIDDQTRCVCRWSGTTTPPHPDFDQMRQNQYRLMESIESRRRLSRRLDHRVRQTARKLRRRSGRLVRTLIRRTLSR